jgi:biopolymer transport protein ExbB
MTAFEWFQQGGTVMWLLLACSGVGFALVFERAFFWVLERRRVDLDELEGFFGRIHRGDREEASELASDADTEILHELNQAWDEGGAHSLIEAFDLAINRIEDRAHRYLYGLKTIVSVSPLLGILGTVLGIIQSFDVLGSAGAVANPQAVGAGLAEALITTAFGLMIAVPGLIAHNYFKAKARKYVDTLDGYADELAFHLEANGSHESAETAGTKGHPDPANARVEEPVNG